MPFFLKVVRTGEEARGCHRVVIVAVVRGLSEGCHNIYDPFVVVEVVYRPGLCKAH